MPEPQSSRWTLLVGVAFVAVAVPYLFRGKAWSPRSAASASAQAGAAPPSARSPSAPLLQLGAPPAAPAAPSDDAAEASLMKRLRELADGHPSESLRLALDGNARFPASADAPERGWFLCKSLVNLQRFDEAVAQARSVVERYPGTPWAADLERHLLAAP